MLIREKYLAKIRGFYHTESLIKIIYGMRRSGKSVILTQIKDELLNQGIKEDNIIYIKGKLSIKEEESAKLIAREIRDINDKDSLKINNHNNSYIKNKKQSKTGIFVKIDSLENQQLINSIEKISLQYKGNQDIYVCTEQPKKMFRWEKIKVNINSELQLKLQELLGQENVIVKN